MGEGRGRINRIKALPEEALPFVRAAEKALAEDRLTQGEILDELNRQLAKLGIEPISKSGFHRHSMAMNISLRKLAQKRECMAAFVNEIGMKPDLNASLLLTEMGKSLVYDLVETAYNSDQLPSPKDMAQIALTVQRFAMADEKNVKATSAGVDLEERISKKDAAKVAEIAARSAGLSKEVARNIKAEILGIAKT